MFGAIQFSRWGSGPAIASGAGRPRLRHRRLPGTETKGMAAGPRAPEHVMDAIGRPELVLVSGHSGIGKFSVVNELHVNASLAAVEAAGASTGSRPTDPVVPDTVALG